MAVQDDNCNAALEICRQHSSIATAGAASCSLSNEVFDVAGGCQIDAVCTQPSTLGDQALDLAERARLACDVRAGVWECSCTSDEDFVALGEAQGSDPEASCKELAWQCANEMLPSASSAAAPP
jgi:hypothetical protein